MRPLLFGTHALQFGSEDASSGTLTRPAMVRIAKEMSAMMESLPCNPSSSIFLRCDEDRMHLIQAMVIGPEDTPYSGGCFLFNFTIPDSYPSSPPQVRLATTGGGSVSFNPNLYADGYVCLSLLGTWHGDSGEEWSPITSTLLQVLVSLQALVFVPEPYFNEPGYESSIGTPEGTESSKGFNAALVPNTIRLAMLEQMRNPPAGFEEVVRMHFALRRDAILTQARAWLEQAKAYGNEAALAPLVAELEAEMAKLPPAVAA